MQLKPAVKRAMRPGAKLFTKAVNRAIGARLSALENAHGETWSELQGLERRTTFVVEALEALKALPGIETLPGIEGRLAALEQAELDTSSEVQKLATWVPTVLDASSDQHAIARVAVRAERQLTRQTEERLKQFERRLEFIRRELFFELRYGGQGRGIGPSPHGGSDPARGATIAVEPKVLNEAKLRSFGDDIRLNVGAGHVPVEGYLNVDARELDGIDVLADIRSLPFGPGEVSVIYCAHVLEHFPAEEVRRSLLPYWLTLLKEGGRIIAVVPDSEAMLDSYARGEMTFAELREVTFGGQEYDGDFHFNMYSTDSLTALLADAGFVEVAITASARRNGLCYEMQAEGVRPHDAAPASAR